MTPQRFLYKIVLLQVALLAGLGTLVWVVFSIQAAISFVLGGLISIIPGLLFGLIYFKSTGARAAKKVVNAFYIGEALKLFLTVLLFILAFQWKGLEPIPFFLGFILVQVLYWFSIVKSF